jgi:glutamine synthetase
MQKVALRHGLVCLLHEKPFAGINGSGKHNNWSMATSDGQNLLEPGKTPHDNLQFLVFLMAVIAAVDDYSDLLRMSAATPGNDHRLGANEAPPAIISIFLGEQLTDILAQLENGGAVNSKQGGTLNLGASTLPPLPKDNTDRNRTSPFAFTGNKFEFRMVGSSDSIAMPNSILNTIVAETLSLFAERLEKAKDFDAEVKALVKEMARAHKKVIFNGNNYSEEWVTEAEKRGLPNIRSTVEATQALTAPKNVRLLEKHGVLNKVEMASRCEIMLETYIKTIRIEALTMLEMAKRQILPAAVAYISDLAGSIQGVKATGLDADTGAQAGTLKEVSAIAASFKKNITLLESKLEEANGLHGDTTSRRARSATRCSPRWWFCAKTVTSWKNSSKPAFGRIRPTATCCSTCDPSRFAAADIDQCESKRARHFCLALFLGQHGVEYITTIHFLRHRRWSSPAPAPPARKVFTPEDHRRSSLGGQAPWRGQGSGFYVSRPPEMWNGLDSPAKSAGYSTGF